MDVYGYSQTKVNQEAVSGGSWIFLEALQRQELGEQQENSHHVLGYWALPQRRWSTHNAATCCFAPQKSEVQTECFLGLFILIGRLTKFTSPLSSWELTFQGFAAHVASIKVIDQRNCAHWLVHGLANAVQEGSGFKVWSLKAYLGHYIMK